MARILIWLVKCKGKHIWSAKPALLDFDKLAQIALVLQSRMGRVSALILPVWQTLCTENADNKTDKENEKPHKPAAFPSYHDGISLCKKDLLIPPPSGNSVHQHL